MLNRQFPNIKGILFDYGGTLDTRSRHWAHVLWEGFRHAAMPVTEAQFREAYVFGERALARNPIIRPEDDFHTLLQKKVALELGRLVEMGAWQADEAELALKKEEIAAYCDAYARKAVEESKVVLEQLRECYPLVIVSNFYGNIHAVLEAYGILHFFDAVVESAVVGVRKPDPAIFALGVEALDFAAEETLVVGDSFGKDIVPARAAGCKTVWFKGEGWEDKEEDESLPDAIITSLGELVSD